jgi:hypothetical protein
VITPVTVTPPRPLTPQVAVQVTSSTQPGQVTLTWGDQADQPAYYLVLGPGVPQNGAEVTASRSGQSYEIAGLPAGAHSWQVVPFWNAAGEIVGDESLGARVTTTIHSMTVGPSLARTIALPGFTASGGWTNVGPRTISLSGFTGRGTIYVGPRTITLDGWTANGPFAPIQGVVK